MNNRYCYLLYIAFTVLVFGISIPTPAQSKSKDSYKFTIDLVKVTDDKVKVDLQPPAIDKSEITYHFPKIVPGTYSEDDYGRYIEQFKAFDKKGDTLPVAKSDVNSWTISNAKKLHRISYLVNDSYDDGLTKQVIFEPAGSNIQKDTNYVINNHCFLGYFDNMKNMPYEVTILHPANMYGSTALNDLDSSPTSDRFVTESYNRIVDNPFMYDIPDTATIRVGNSEVLISVYSPTHKVSAAFLAEKLSTLLQAQGKYLGGKLPVEKYAFIIYLDTKPFSYSHGEGALEHSYCSVYYYPERPADKLGPEFVDHAAHEFFHIITPLTIHSDEIQNFDFNSPKMSRHLWLYEGSTEYHAQLVQVQYGLMTPDEFLNVLSKKIAQSKAFYNDTVPITTMSAQVLGKYKQQFGNVYQKGAIINMCLDIKLLQLSHGKYGIMNLINDLSKKYGKQKGFEDSALFSEIERLTFPEIRQFLDTYVGGPNPLPLQEIFNIVGVRYEKEGDSKDSSFSLGRVATNYNVNTGRVVVVSDTGLNWVGKQLGYQIGDEWVSINGKEITSTNQRSVINELYKNAKVGDSLVVKVMRKEASGDPRPIYLRSTMQKFPVRRLHVLTFMDNANEEQLKLRNIWLSPRSGDISFH
ncbi:MAG: peptidase M61 [Bacteroidetes bacterium]|nr:MAG: peptidase M61 [Bacteroidota bacterium]